MLKIVKCLEEATLLTKRVSETVENEVKEQKGGMLGILAAILGAHLLSNVEGNMFAGKRVKDIIPEHEATIPGLRVIWAAKGTIRAGGGRTKAGQYF